MAAAPTAISKEIFKDQDFYVPCYRVFVGDKELQVEMNDILSVTYNDSLTEVDSVDLVVNNWEPDPARTASQRPDFKYSDGPTFDPWNTIDVYMGYYRNGTDERQLMLTGEITTFKPSFPSSGASTLTVRGLNLLHRFRVKQETKDFLGKKDSEIAKTLVGLIQAEIKKKTPKLVLQVDDKEIENNLKKEDPVPYLSLHNVYPINFLLERSKRIGYDLWLEELPSTKDPRKVTLHYRPSYQVQRTTYVMEWGKSLISFDPTVQTANQVSEVTVQGWDPKSKTPIKATATRAKLKADNLGVLDPLDLDMKETNLSQKIEIVADRPVTGKKEAEDTATMVLRQLAQGLVEAKGKTVGLPDLRSGRKIEIRGLGKRFSGIYLVTSTTHTISEGGYTTDFNARMEQRVDKKQGGA